jgi:GNAT superfamily N-acetyltransferase
VYRRASLSNAGDRDNLLAHPEYLVLGPEGLAEGRTYVAELDGSVAGFATWAEADGVVELEDLFVDPDRMRHGIATALVARLAEVLRARGVGRLEVTANPHALAFYRAAGFTGCGVRATEFGTADGAGTGLTAVRAGASWRRASGCAAGPSRNQRAPRRLLPRRRPGRGRTCRG